LTTYLLLVSHTQRDDTLPRTLEEFIFRTPDDDDDDDADDDDDDDDDDYDDNGIIVAKMAPFSRSSLPVTPELARITDAVFCKHSLLHGYHRLDRLASSN